MNPLTLEWVRKAEGDFAAIALHQQVPAPNFDMLCLHAQQCIEKYLKAWLQEANIPFSKTHDLETLLDLIAPTVPAWQMWQPDFAKISDHAVDLRYPGKFATATEAQHALPVCTQVREAIRSALKLPETEQQKER